MSICSDIPIGHILDKVFLCSFLCEHLSHCDVTGYTHIQAPANSAVLQSGVYFQNFTNSQKIKEVIYNYNYFCTDMIWKKIILFLHGHKGG